MAAKAMGVSVASVEQAVTMRSVTVRTATGLVTTVAPLASLHDAHAALDCLTAEVLFISHACVSSWL